MMMKPPIRRISTARLVHPGGGVAKNANELRATARAIPTKEIAKPRYTIHCSKTVVWKTIPSTAWRSNRLSE